MKEKIYFDNNATTKIAPKVLEEMILSYGQPANSSSSHYFGRAANKLVNEARESIKKLLNAENYQVIFTSGGTESNNTVLMGFADYQIIISAIEHSSVYNISLKKNAIIIRAREDGLVDIKDFQEKLAKLQTKNFLVSIMLANNETGVVQPIKEIAKLTHQYGGLIHSDIIQGVGKIPVDLEDLNIDMASISAHKIGGPQGVGVILVRNGIDIQPLMFGASQEKGKRPGSINVVGAVGIGEACKIALEKISEYQKIAILRDYLEENLKKIAGDDVVIFGDKAARLANTSYIATKSLDNQTQLIHFDLNNIAISIGAACSSGASKNSRVLNSMNVPDDIASSAIRISLSAENNKEEVDQFINVWRKLYIK